VKPLTAGSEIDAWCTRCRMDLGHRIVAMVGGAPKRVICQTCNSEHNYRAPRSEKEAAVARTRGTSAPRAPRTASQRVAERQKAEATRVNDWEKRVAGQAVDSFTRYSIDKRYAEGELLSHKKFGEGYVLEVVDPHKVTVMFRDGPKTLAHGQT
jgi:hypothetical protein